MREYQLAISNIAWQQSDDEEIYTAMQHCGFTGLEIAPTRIFPSEPYENLTGAALFGGYLRNRWGFHVPSLQSIWYGLEGNIFDPADTERLLDYTAQAFQFAHTVNCPSLVFGCPKNRMRPLGADDAAAEAFALVKRLDNPGLAVNLDLSTMLAQGENLQDFLMDLSYVSHIHISETGLAPIQPRPVHRELALLLGAVGYRGAVSVEMARTDADTVKRTMAYIAEVFQ